MMLRWPPSAPTSWPLFQGCWKGPLFINMFFFSLGWVNRGVATSNPQRKKRPAGFLSYILTHQNGNCIRYTWCSIPSWHPKIGRCIRYTWWSQQLGFFELLVTCVSCNTPADDSSFAYVRFAAWRDARGQHDWQVPGRGEPSCDRVLGQEQCAQEDWILGNRRWKEPHDSGTVKGKAGAVFDWQCGVPAWCTTLASLHRHVARTGSCCGGRQVPANLPASSGNQQSSSRSKGCGHSTFAAISYRSLSCFNTCFNTTSWALSHHMHQMFWDAMELPVQWTMKAFIEL